MYFGERQDFKIFTEKKEVFKIMYRNFRKYYHY